jgi:hypothetical protein
MCDHKKSAFLLDKFTQFFNPIIAALPGICFPWGFSSSASMIACVTHPPLACCQVFSRLLGADLGVNDDSDPYYQTLVHKFPDLAATLLDRSRITVSEFTIDPVIYNGGCRGSKMRLISALTIKPSSEFVPGAPMWTLNDGNKNKGVHSFFFDCPFPICISRACTLVRRHRLRRLSHHVYRCHCDFHDNACMTFRY